MVLPGALVRGVPPKVDAVLVAAVAEAAKLLLPVANAEAANVLAASAQLVPAVVTRARRIDVQPAPNW